jgi:hypothetical protein
MMMCDRHFFFIWRVLKDCKLGSCAEHGPNVSHLQVCTSHCLQITYGMALQLVHKVSLPSDQSNSSSDSK